MLWLSITVKNTVWKTLHQHHSKLYSIRWQYWWSKFINNNSINVIPQHFTNARFVLKLYMCTLWVSLEDFYFFCQNCMAPRLKNTSYSQIFPVVSKLYHLLNFPKKCFSKYLCFVSKCCLSAIFYIYGGIRHSAPEQESEAAHAHWNRTRTMERFSLRIGII